MAAISSTVPKRFSGIGRLTRLGGAGPPEAPRAVSIAPGESALQVMLVRRQLDRQRAHQPFEARLGGRDVAAVGRADMGRDAGQRDEGAAALAPPSAA